MLDTEEQDKWKKRFERERIARKEAELLLEKKSLELFKANEELKVINSGLDGIIQKRTELLQQQKAQIETILSNIVSPMLITSKKNRKIIYANPEAAVQYKVSLDKLIGSTIDIVYTDQNDSIRIRDALISNGNYLYGMELRFKAFDDSQFDALLSLVEIHFNGEECFLGMVTDITKQKQREAELQKLHKDMKASIEYASLIQRSIIPNSKLLINNFKESFAIWQPRDIVGGDIYFIEEIEIRNEIVVMVIDCTGHGVPGAFLTMLVKAIEKQIIETLLNQNTPSSPSKILHSFNLKLRETLLQQNEDVAHSGFDGAILIYNKEKKSINYSGAKIPLYFVRDGDITIFKGDRQSIGYSRTDMNFEFKEHNIEIKDGDLIYITTDGYIDQIGGEKGFPFSNKNFKNFIADNLNLPFETQKINFIETIETYRGDKIKNDDITVVGFKF